MSVKRPHIIIFNPDEMRSDALHHLGNEAAVTPNMDQLAKEGVSFRNAFCQNPVCTPSRCSFMSGWYPHVRGHRTMFHMMQEDEPVLLKELKDEGYYVWMNGRGDLVAGQNDITPYCNEIFRPMDLNPTPKKKSYNPEGLDYSMYEGKLELGEDGKRHDLDSAWVEGAIEFIRNRPKDKPICIFLPLLFPHPPYGVEEPYYSIIDRNKVPERIPAPENWESKPSILKGLYDLQNLQDWPEDRWTDLRAIYLGQCARVDNQLGMVIEALKEEGIYDDSAIFVFSDHGDFTGDYGIVEKNQNTFEDCLTKVPLIVKPSKDIPVKPGVSEALVELIDFYATVEDFTGMKPTHTHFGLSLRDVISNGGTLHRDAVFCEGGRLHGEKHCVEGNGKEVNKQNHYYPRNVLQRSEGPEHTKAVMCRTQDYKYVRRLYEQDELYDLRNDPKELNNVINNLAYKDILNELEKRTLDWFLSTSDVVPFRIDDRFTKEDFLVFAKGVGINGEKYEKLTELLEVYSPSEAIMKLY